MEAGLLKESSIR